MFNSSARREAIEKLNEAVGRHETVRKDVEHVSVQLFDQRQRAVSDVIGPVEKYVNLLANSPKEFDKSVAEFRIEVDRFTGTVQHLETEAARSTKIGSATGTAGAAAGVGVAALGPSAAMAVATTFGTASTGTAISALSGAAPRTPRSPGSEVGPLRPAVAAWPPETRSLPSPDPWDGRLGVSLLQGRVSTSTSATRITQRRPRSSVSR